MAAAEGLLGSFDNDIHNTISSHNLHPNHYINDSLGYNEGRKDSLQSTLSVSVNPQLSIPRHDSVLISEFEVEHIRQIQNFLLFPILHPLSEEPQPTPEIWQVTHSIHFIFR